MIRFISFFVIEFVGSCSDKSLLSITFDFGLELYSNKTPSNYNFSASYKQQFPFKIEKGQFGFVNAVPNSHGNWHAIAK